MPGKRKAKVKDRDVSVNTKTDLENKTTKRKRKESPSKQNSECKRRKTSTDEKEKEKAKAENFSDSTFITPTVHSMPQKKRRLDSIARILEADNICIAVCKINNELLVTGNNIKEYERKDKHFLEGQNIELIKDILSHFMLVAKKGKDKQSSINCLLKICKKDPKIANLSFLDIHLFEKVLNMLYLSENIERINNKIIGASARELFGMGFLNQDEIDIWEKSDHDRSFKKEARVVNRKIEQVRDISRYCWHLVSDFRKSESYFKARKKSINSCKILGIGGKNEHAEVRMIGYLLDKGILQSKKSPVYIGISKLCCAYCAGIVYVTNSVFKTNLGLMHEIPEEDERSQIFREKVEITGYSINETEGDMVQIRGFHGLYKPSWESSPAYLDGRTYLSTFSVIKEITFNEQSQVVDVEGKHIVLLKENFKSAISAKQYKKFRHFTTSMKNTLCHEIEEKKQHAGSEAVSMWAEPSDSTASPISLSPSLIQGSPQPPKVIPEVDIGGKLLVLGDLSEAIELFDEPSIDDVVSSNDLGTQSLSLKPM